MDSSRDDLVKRALIAVRETLQGETHKSSARMIAVVGVGEAFHVLGQETVQQLIYAFEIVVEDESPAAETSTLAAEAGATMEGSAATEEGTAPMDI